MADTQFEALHQVRIATEDILSGYKMLREKEKYKDDPNLGHLSAFHQKHIGEVRERQSALGYSNDGDSVEVILQDWVDSLAGEESDFVDRGERALLNTYQEALKGWSESDDPDTRALLKRQYDEITEEIGRLGSAGFGETRAP